MFSRSLNFFGEFYLVNAHLFEHSRQYNYFKIRIIPLRIYENFEGGFVDILKDKLSDSSSIGLSDV